MAHWRCASLPCPPAVRCALRAAQPVGASSSLSIALISMALPPAQVALGSQQWWDELEQQSGPCGGAATMVGRAAAWPPYCAAEPAPSRIMRTALTSVGVACVAGAARIHTRAPAGVKLDRISMSVTCRPGLSLCRCHLRCPATSVTPLSHPATACGMHASRSRRGPYLVIQLHHREAVAALVLFQMTTEPSRCVTTT